TAAAEDNATKPDGLEASTGPPPLEQLSSSAPQQMRPGADVSTGVAVAGAAADSASLSVAQRRELAAASTIAKESAAAAELARRLTARALDLATDAKAVAQRQQRRLERLEEQNAFLEKQMS